MTRPYSHRSYDEADPGMYDDHSPQPYDEPYQRRSPSDRDQYSRSDIPRSPPRGPSAMVDPYSTDRHGGYDRRGRSRSPRRENRRGYYDRDREDYQSPVRHRSRSRERSPYYGGPPNRTIILEGLPLNMTQEDVGHPCPPRSFTRSLLDWPLWPPLCIQIFNELHRSYNPEHLEEIRLIKDKRTGLSRQFGFAQFATTPDAKTFLDRHYPSITLYGPYDPTQAADAESAKVRIAFSRDKDDRDKPGKNDDDWSCEVCYLANYSHRQVCFRCNTPKPYVPPSAFNPQPNVLVTAQVSSGDSDVSTDNNASQFLILRGLKPEVSEELLAKGVAKLYKSENTSLPATTAEPRPPKKLKASTAAKETNVGAREGSLRRVLLVRDRKTNESWKYGFAEFDTVDDARAAMAKFNSLEKFTISSKPIMVSYIHAGVFVPVLHAIPDEEVHFTFSPLSNPSIRLRYWDEAGYAKEFVLKQESRLSDAEQRNATNARLAAEAANEGLVSGKEGDAKAKKRKAEKDASSSSAKKVIAPHLQFWSNQHAELHGISPKEVSSQEDTPPADTPPAKPPRDESVPPSRSYADLKRKCCLLCSRQFKTEAEVNKHERISQLHRDNLMNEDLVTKALAKLKPNLTDAESDSTYRDRAKERRQAFNQPKQPAAQHSKGPKAQSKPEKEEEEPATAPAPSKGAALLGKMGWTKGEGLGKEGTGMTSAIQTEAYTQGVGLGAVGGKLGDAVEEAQKQTKGGYAAFVDTTKERAKERFESMK